MNSVILTGKYNKEYRFHTLQNWRATDSLSPSPSLSLSLSLRVRKKSKVTASRVVVTLEQGSSIGGPRTYERKMFGPRKFQIMWHENSNAALESDINLHRVYTGRDVWCNKIQYNL